MRRRHPPRTLPHLWLITDERQGEELMPAIARLPRGAGIVFRHHGVPARARRSLFDAVLSAARRRGLLVMLAEPPAVAVAWGADGSHGRWQEPTHGLLRSASVHDRAELVAARRARADFIFVSPVFATRSHPGARSLGPVRLGLLTCAAAMPVLALGGMTESRSRRLRGYRLHGWAAIDAWSDQKRKAVPR